MTSKEFNLLNKLITSLGYNINEIEDIFDYEEFCEHIIQEQKELRKKAKALEEIEKIVKINCEEICGRKFEDCNDTSCLSAEILNIINKAKEN